MIAYLITNQGTQVIDIMDIAEEDQTWFEHNNVSVTLEQVQEDEFSLYADVPALDGGDNETPREITTISASTEEKCRDALTRLRQVCETAISENLNG